MKDFFLDSPINALALRPPVVELRGHRIALAGVISAEPLARGCDQRKWLEQLVALGVRHLVVPLNGTAEDTCVYARSHLDSSENIAVYDLMHRDEGFFSRLKFLLDAANEIGVLVGLSLFNVNPANRGPLRRSSNAQALALREAVYGTNPQAGLLNKMEASMLLAVDWISAVIKSRPGVWVEIFRDKIARPLSASSDETAAEPPALLDTLERLLAKRVAAALTRNAEDDNAARRGGPWIVMPGSSRREISGAHEAPFGIASQTNLQLHSPRLESHNRLPLLRRVSEKPTARSWPAGAALWAGLMQGCWPLVSCGTLAYKSRVQQRHWKDLSLISTFGRQWAGSGYLRPCPEILTHLKDPFPDIIRAATEGMGRYFITFSARADNALDLSVLPGTYRYAFFDTATGRRTDFGDGIEGGSHCRVPGAFMTRDGLIILEQEECPDPASVW